MYINKLDNQDEMHKFQNTNYQLTPEENTKILPEIKP